MAHKARGVAPSARFLLPCKRWMHVPVFSCCAGACLLGGACSSEHEEGLRTGNGGTGAVAGTATAGRSGGGAAGRGSGGNAGGAGGRTDGRTSGAGRGGACDEEITNGLIQRTLEEYCRGDHDCPRTLEAARRNVNACGEYEFSEEETGCGYTIVTFYGEEHGRGFVFDGTTLVGAWWLNDVIKPPCDTRGEVGGVYLPSCPGVQRCRICDREDGAGGEGPFCDFDGGAGGGAGRGGQSGGSG